MFASAPSSRAARPPSAPRGERRADSRPGSRAPGARRRCGRTPARGRASPSGGRRPVEVGRVDERATRSRLAALLSRSCTASAHVAHVEVEREAVEQQHHGRHAEQHAERQRVAQDLAQLLPATARMRLTPAPRRAPSSRARSVDEDVLERGHDRSTVAGHVPGRVERSRTRSRPVVGVVDHHVQRACRRPRPRAPRVAPRGGRARRARRACAPRAWRARRADRLSSATCRARSAARRA